MDQSTNNNINPFCIAIDSNCTVLFKVLLILLKTRENLRELNANLSKAIISSNIGFVINRKYDKYEQTLLLKAVEKRNIEIVRYLVEEFPSTLHIYETDKELQNCLHYSVKIAKDQEFIKFFTKLDFDKNQLRTQKDKHNKAPQEYDNSKQFELYFNSIWDAAKANNLTVIEKLVSNGYYNIDDQTNLYKNTAAHIAAMNSSDKILLFLVKNNANLEIKNSRGLTARDYCEKNPSKLFIKKYKAIFSFEVKEYNELEAIGRNNISVLNSTLNNINNKIIQKIIEDINTKAIEKKINFKKLFDVIDTDKNSSLNLYYRMLRWS